MFVDLSHIYLTTWLIWMVFIQIASYLSSDLLISQHLVVEVICSRNESESRLKSTESNRNAVNIIIKL